MASADKYFALFDDTVQKLKVVRMTEIPKPEMLVMLSPSREGAATQKLQIVKSNESEPMLSRIQLDPGKHLYLWRSPWCMYHETTRCWIPILDSDKREAIPGDFTYSSMHIFYNPWYSEYKSLHRTMVQRVESLEKDTFVRTIPTAPIQIPLPKSSGPPVVRNYKPPTFVAHIIKRDAIANRTTCSISLEEFTHEMKTQVTPCFHIFDSRSLNEWVSLQGCCPMCKVPLSNEDCVLL